MFTNVVHSVTSSMSHPSPLYNLVLCRFDLDAPQAELSCPESAACHLLARYA